MKRKLSELDFQPILLFKFLDTPGDEVAPGSDKIGENFENKRIGHRTSFQDSFNRSTVQ